MLDTSILRTLRFDMRNNQVSRAESDLQKAYRGIPLTADYIQQLRCKLLAKYLQLTPSESKIYCKAKADPIQDYMNFRKRHSKQNQKFYNLKNDEKGQSISGFLSRSYLRETTFQDSSPKHLQRRTCLKNLNQGN